MRRMFTDTLEGAMKDDDSRGSASSTLTPQRSVVWLESDRRSWRNSWISRAESDLPSPLSPRRLDAISPHPWFDMRPSPSSDRLNETTYSESVYSTAHSDPAPIPPPISATERAIVLNSMSNTTEIEQLGDRPKFNLERQPEKEPRPSVVLSIDSQSEYPNNTRLILITISLGLLTFIVSLDRTIISTAIPTITNYFNIFNSFSWYPSVYLLTAAALQPAWSKIYQAFNLRGTYIVAILIFLLGSVLSAVAPSNTVLIVGRALSGLGSSGELAGALTILTYIVSPERHPTFQGGLIACLAIGILLGPVFGGLITDRLVWRWCFYINLPVVVVALPVDAGGTLSQRLGQIDLISPLILVAAVVCLLTALGFGGLNFAWDGAHVVLLLTAFAILTSLWMFLQYRLREKATVPVRLMLQRTVFFACLFSFFAGAAAVTLIIYLPLYFQAIKGISAAMSGVDMLPLILSATISALVSGSLVSMIGYYNPFMIFGMAIFTVGAGLLHSLDENSSIAACIGYQILAGIGMGLNFQTPIIAVQTVSESWDTPVTTAITLFFSQLGGAISLVVMQSILLNKLVPRIQAVDPSITSDVIIQAGATGLTQLVSTPEELPGFLAAYANSFSSAVILIITAGAISVLLALGVEWRNIKPKNQKPRTSPEDKKNVAIVS